MEEKLAIETRNLNYSFFGKRKVVDDVSLQVPKGSIYGFLGPNGAGKTTTMRLIAGLLNNTSDNIFINGVSLQQNVPAIFNEIGTLIETPSLYLHLTAFENLQVIATMKGIGNESIDPLLDQVGLLPVRQKKVSTFSLGMKQRLGIATALINHPSILMLDEPVNGLDPNGMVEMRELLIRLNQERGTTILISSHLLSEIEKMCTHIGFIVKGKLQYEGTLQNLYALAGQRNSVEFTVGHAAAWQNSLQQQGVESRLLADDKLEFTIQNHEEIARLNQMMVQAGAAVTGIVSKDGLESWFMQQVKTK